MSDQLAGAFLLGVVHKPDLVVEHSVRLVSDCPRCLPFSAKFASIGDDVAVGANRTRLELLMPIDLQNKNRQQG